MVGLPTIYECNEEVGSIAASSVYSHHSAYARYPLQGHPAERDGEWSAGQPAEKKPSLRRKAKSVVR
jgi:hypothetical protein